MSALDSRKTRKIKQYARIEHTPLLQNRNWVCYKGWLWLKHVQGFYKCLSGSQVENQLSRLDFRPTLPRIHNLPHRFLQELVLNPGGHHFDIQRFWEKYKYIRIKKVGKSYFIIESSYLIFSEYNSPVWPHSSCETFRDFLLPNVSQICEIDFGIDIFY